MGIQGKNTRTEEQRELDLVQLSDLLCQGCYTQQELANIIGVSRTQIIYDINDLKTRWKEEQLDNLEEIKKQQLKKLSVVQKEAWKAWNNDKKKKSKESLKIGENSKGSFTEEILTEESYSPNDRYLAIITNCIKEENEILGIKKLSDTSINFTQNQVNVNIEIPEDIKNLPEFQELLKANEIIIENQE